MHENEILEKIKYLLTKFPDGITLTHAEILTLYLLHLHKEEADENDFIDKEIVDIAIQRSFGYLSSFDCEVPLRTDTVMEKLIKKGFLLYSSTEKNAYYISEISSSVLRGLFNRDTETTSDVESNLNTILLSIKSLENADESDIDSFFRHTFFDLILKLDIKIKQLKEDIVDSKWEIKSAIRSGSEESFSYFLQGLEKIRERLKEISTSLSKYSSYNQILYMMNTMEKRFENSSEVTDNIHKASRKLFSIKNELENTLTDVTEFINRHVSLITSQISISALDKILEFQKKLLNEFTAYPVYLRKPKRLKVADFKYNWKTQERKPVYIDTENTVLKEEVDTLEREELKKIIDYIMKELEEKNYVDYIQTIMQFDLVKENLPKYYNKILYELPEICNVFVKNSEFKYENCYLSEISLSKQKVKDAGNKYN